MDSYDIDLEDLDLKVLILIQIHILHHQVILKMYHLNQMVHLHQPRHLLANLI